MIQNLKRKMEDLNKENKIVNRKNVKRSKPKVSYKSTYESFESMNRNSFSNSISTDEQLDFAHSFFGEKLEGYDSEAVNSAQIVDSKNMKIVYKKVRTFSSEKEIVLEKFWKKYSQHSLKNGKTLYYRCRFDEKYCTMKSQVVYNKFTEEIEYHVAEGEHKHLGEIIESLKKTFEIVSTERPPLHPLIEMSDYYNDLTIMYCNSYPNCHSHNFNANDYLANYSLQNADIVANFDYEENEIASVSVNSSTEYEWNSNFATYEDSPKIIEIREHYDNSVNSNVNCCDSINSEGVSMNSSDFFDTSLLESLDYINEFHSDQNQYTIYSSENLWDTGNVNNDEIPSISSFSSDILSNNSPYDYDIAKVSLDSNSASYAYNSEEYSSESKSFFYEFTIKPLIRTKRFFKGCGIHCAIFLLRISIKSRNHDFLGNF